MMTRFGLVTTGLLIILVFVPALIYVHIVAVTYSQATGIPLGHIWREWSWLFFIAGLIVFAQAFVTIAMPIAGNRLGKIPIVSAILTPHKVDLEFQQEMRRKTLGYNRVLFITAAVAAAASLAGLMILMLLIEVDIERMMEPGRIFVFSLAILVLGSECAIDLKASRSLRARRYRLARVRSIYRTALIGSLSIAQLFLFLAILKLAGPLSEWYVNSYGALELQIGEKVVPVVMTSEEIRWLVMNRVQLGVDWVQSVLTAVVSLFFFFSLGIPMLVLGALRQTVIFFVAGLCALFLVTLGERIMPFGLLGIVAVTLISSLAVQLTDPLARSGSWRRARIVPR